MIRVVGLETGKLYAQGTEEDCFRRLHDKFPTFKDDPDGSIRQVMVDPIYPEALKVEGVE